VLMGVFFFFFRFVDIDAQKKYKSVGHTMYGFKLFHVRIIYFSQNTFPPPDIGDTNECVVRTFTGRGQIFFDSNS